MTIPELQTLEQDLKQLIHDLNMPEVFALMRKHNLFQGYQVLQDEFILDKLKGVKYKRFQDRLLTFIHKQIDSAIGKANTLPAPPQVSLEVPQANVADENEKQAYFWFERGDRLQVKKDRIIAYDKAIALKPDFAEAYFERGQVKNSLRKYIEAIDDYISATRYKFDYIEAYYELGCIYTFNLKEYENSIKFFTEVILLNQRYKFAYYFRGLAEYYFNQYNLAIKDYQQSLQTSPYDSEIYYNISQCYSCLGEKKNTLRYLQKVIELDIEYKFSIRNSPDFKWLREDADFKKLVT